MYSLLFRHYLWEGKGVREFVGIIVNDKPAPVLFALLKSMNYEELSEKEFQELFAQWFKPIRNFVYYRCGDADLAEDIAQDAFMKLWEVRAKIDKSTVKALLYRIAQNTTINHLKRKQLKFRYVKSERPASDFDSPEKLMQMSEYDIELQRVINLLPDGGREVFLMNRLEDLTYQEIANRLGLSVKAIEKRMSKVLQIFRDQLGIDI
ncbi:MAG: RNA polymerase sigma factor [Flavobacteriales bacterium]